MILPMLTLLGTALVLVGLLLVLIGALMFLVAAFREGLLWGLGVLFVPPLPLVFLIVHWSKARDAFFLKLWGIALLVLGVVVAGNDLPWPIG
mgnify:CR=1 FL=1